MTETQLLTICLSVMLPLSALIYSNARVSDIGKRIDDVGKRIDDLGKRMDDRFDAFEKRIDEKIDNGFEHMGLLLKLHEAEHHRP